MGIFNRLSKEVKKLSEKPFLKEEASQKKLSNSENEKISPEIESQIASTQKATNTYRTYVPSEEDLEDKARLEKLKPILAERFKSNKQRHGLIKWEDVERKLEAAPVGKIWSLNRMEETGGEPDVVRYDSQTDEFIFFDCSTDSPIARRNCVYDKQAEDYLRENHPEEQFNGNAVDMAAEMGIEILNREEYLSISKFGKLVDWATHSWVKARGSDDTRDVLYGFNSGADNKMKVRDNIYPHSHDPCMGFRGSIRI